MRKALLRALLEPRARLREAEAAWDFTARLAMFEEQKSMPWTAVWDHYCLSRDTPVGLDWLDRVRHYERTVLTKRETA
jgi:L-rhamnose isomerase